MPPPARRPGPPAGRRPPPAGASQLPPIVPARLERSGQAPPRPRGGTPAPMRRPPPPKPAPRAPDKPFEIRRGRRSSDDEDSPEGEEAIGQVVLPRSITQEAEEDSLKRRFGSESLPDITGKAPILQVAQSVGESGPDRARTGAKVALVMMLLLLAGAAAWWFTRAP